MSSSPTSRSSDLRRLVDEGFKLEVRGDGYLLVHDVPYVTAESTVARGTLVSVLDMDGEATVQPRSHVVMFAGGVPHDADGSRMSSILNSSSRKQLAPGLTIDHTFSSKPPGGYRDYHHKMSTYAAMLEGPAQSIDSSATARTFEVVEADDGEGPFNYIDTASSRAGIAIAAAKLKAHKIAIVGLGGTGAYILDLVAKTPVAEIHLYDGDRFLQHNAFRSPGAAALHQLRGGPPKVRYFRNRYKVLHRGIKAHPAYVDEDNVDQLADMDFVFIGVDRGVARQLLVESLERLGRSFIDVGMGLSMRGEAVGGLLRVTTSTPDKRDHVHELSRIPLGGDEEDEIYGSNAQVADLNALNATLAVIKWKKMLGFYADSEHEHHSLYTVDGNVILNEDPAE
jgi:hypothetical protein